MKRSLCALVLMAGLLPGPARAEDAKVEVTAEVVLASNQVNPADPSLDGIKQAFASEHFNFASLKRLSTDKLQLRHKKPTEVKLPDGRVVSLKLESLKKGKASVGIAMPDGVNTSYTLSHEGTVLVNVGHLPEGELYLVLYPLNSAGPSGSK